MSLFGSSGIRGIANLEISPELALNVGKALGTLHSGNIVIGSDPRSSGQMLKSAVASGILSAGASAVDVGMVSTPTLAYAARKRKCGAMLTASHNPPEYNGIKLWNPDGSGFGVRQSDEVEKLMNSGRFKAADWKKIGALEFDPNAVEEHKNAILSAVGQARGVKIVLDCGCGAGSTITPYLLREMGCGIIAINSQPDGFFPARPPEPTDANLSMLKKCVVDSGADLGIAHDGDADRMCAMDRSGNYISNDLLLAFFAKFEKAKRIVVPMDTSMALEDYTGARVTRTKVGDVFISEALKEKEGDFGGEPSGTWIFPKFSYCPDGIYAAARIAKLASELDVAEELKKIPSYPMMRGKVECTNDKKRKAMDGIKKALMSAPHKSMNSIDGIRIDMDDGWLMVRQSGTEPIIRISVEARDKMTTRKLYDFAFATVKSALKGV